MAHPLTGDEVRLRHGRYSASVVTLGASLRSLEHELYKPMFEAGIEA